MHKKIKIMLKSNFFSATLVPAFYLMIGVVFIFAPEIPSADLKIEYEKIKISLLFTQEIGVFFYYFFYFIKANL